MSVVTEDRKLNPTEIFEILRHCPALNSDFKNAVYVDKPIDTNTDFHLEPEKEFDIVRAYQFLRQHQLPTTIAEMRAATNEHYDVMIVGEQRYNVGQQIVLFDQAVYSSGDLDGHVWIVDVLTEFDFPGDIEHVTRVGDGVEVALKEYIDAKQIRLTKAAGIRMYNPYTSYSFAKRYNRG